MAGDADMPKRSSSPLKRRASSIDQESDGGGVAPDTEIATVTSRMDVSGNSGGGFDSPVTELPRALSVVDMLDADKSSEIPSIAEQINIIQSVIKLCSESPLKAGDVAYLVSRSWVDRALALGKDPSYVKKYPVENEPLGPIDNSDIISEIIGDGDDDATFVRLKPGVDMKDFEIFPKDAWDSLVEWYGIKDGQPPIVRTAIDTSENGSNIIFETHPLVFSIHRLWSENSPLKVDVSAKTPPLVMVQSRKSSFNEFLKSVKILVDIPLDRIVRLWVVTGPMPQCEPRPQPATALPISAQAELAQNSAEPVGFWIDIATASSLERDVDRVLAVAKDETGNEKYNGKSTFSTYGMVQDASLIIDEQIDSKTWVFTCSSGRGRGISPTASSPTTSSKGRLNNGNDSGRTSPALQGPMTRGRAQQKRSARFGVVGFQNLGNTCYMNSALQCVRSVEELTKYFVTGEYKAEVNENNVLGYGGQVAHAYGKLMREIYYDSRTMVVPRHFKGTVGRCRATFSGWQQQDSQEFLGFLLDGLQEDLSRVKKKPYLQKPDSTDEMINDPQAIKEMAGQVWDITKKRDDSVIADLFTGMYKSTLKCPVCHKISITFDPFNNLTLPLPVEDVMTFILRYFPLNDAPVDIEVEIPKHSTMDKLKEYVAARTGASVDRLLGIEEYKGKIFKIYPDSGVVSEQIQRSDVPNMYELESAPTNIPRRNPKAATVRSMLDVDTPWEDPRAERLVVPVIHMRPNKILSDNRSEATSPPHFIVLTREEAKSLDVIRRKILEKVATFTTWSNLVNESEADNENTDSDMVVTSASDVDSSGEGKVLASSVSGEDDLVDVTMKEDTVEAARKPAELIPEEYRDSGPGILKKFNTRRPKFVNPQEYLQPLFQNLFELHYFFDGASGSDAIPTGWHNVDVNHSFPTLSSRLPQAGSTEESSPESSPLATGSDDGEDEPDGDQPPPPTFTNSHSIGESSEEEAFEHRPVHKVLRHGTHAKRSHGNKKYKLRNGSNKRAANKRRNNQIQRGKLQTHEMANVKPLPQPQPQPQPQPVPQDDGGPLIRLGEGIIVEWSGGAWDMVFDRCSGSDYIDRNGLKTFADVEQLRDPGLDERRKARQSRRNLGITLEECLDEFEKAEILSEQDMWYCPRCKEHRRASKKFDLWKTPDILVCHLKRFSTAGPRRDKLDVHVDFPTEGLDLSRRVIDQEDGREEMFDLIAVDDHYGGLGGGHYTAYAKNFVDGKWYNYNDGSATAVVDPTSVVSSAAYLLFYRRRSSVPLGGPRFARVLAKFDNAWDEDTSGSGEDQRLAVGSSPRGSSAYLEAETTPPPHGLGSAGGVIRHNSGDDEDDVLPSYEALEALAMDPAIESEADSGGQRQSDLPAPSWNWDGVKGDNQPADFNANASADADADADADAAEYPSDQAEMNDSGDELDMDDVLMPPLEPSNGDAGFGSREASPIRHEAAAMTAAAVGSATEKMGVISVPAPTPEEPLSDEVTEIHLEDMMD